MKAGERSLSRHLPAVDLDLAFGIAQRCPQASGESAKKAESFNGNPAHRLATLGQMTHTAIQEKLDGKAVEWMEKVTDEQYRA